MSYSLHPEAEEDIADVMDFYMEQAGTLVAQRFLDEFERAVNFIVENPGIGTPYARNRKFTTCAASHTRSSSAI